MVQGSICQLGYLGVLGMEESNAEKSCGWQLRERNSKEGSLLSLFPHSKKSYVGVTKNLLHQ